MDNLLNDMNLNETWAAILDKHPDIKAKVKELKASKEQVTEEGDAA